MLKQLESLAIEIIDMCKKKLKNEQLVECNRFVIGVILREFSENLTSIQNNGKVILLNPSRDLWAVRTIIDSADVSVDNFLVLQEKVLEFFKLCQTIDSKYCIYEYNY